MSKLDLSGEQYPHLVSGEFKHRSTAAKAVDNLLLDTNLARHQVDLVEPGDADIPHKVEPETRGIKRTLVRSHLVLGIGGLAAGLLLATLLVLFGPELTRSSPLMTYIALGLLATFGGLLLGGLVSLRPDHDPVISRTRGASASGHWTVVAHCADEAQKTKASEILELQTDKTTRSL